MDANSMKYFATLPIGEIGKELVNLKTTYYDYLETIGHYTLLKVAHQTYYKASIVNGRLRRTGENLEFIEIGVNHYRNLVQHVLSMATSQRPAFEPKAANTDYKSLVQTQLAAGLLEYYMRTKRMEKFIKTATEQTLNYGEGWVYIGWNPTLGEQYGVTENGAPIYEGDIEFMNFTPFDIIRDVSRTDGPQSWLMARKFVNKFDLAAKYPELKDRILATLPETFNDMRFGFRETHKQRKDDIPVYMFFHKQTDAVPEGRITEFVDSDIILTDGPLPYRDIPLYCILSAEKTGSVFGYSNCWDLLPMQQAMDKLHSTVLSNQAAFGVQNIMAPKGNDLNVTQLAGGMNYIEYDAKAGPPSALQLCNTPIEIFNYISILEQNMETIIGVNSVARGNPEQSLKSGSALALVQSMAIQFSQSLQQSYAMLLEDVGTAVINLLRDYATVPRIAMIAGKSNRSAMREFKVDDLEYIQRVMVDMGNPLTRTTSGRVEIATQLIQGGFIKNPQQYLEVLTTGRLEPIYECELAELNLIRSENEKLMDGQPTPVLRTDDHEMHIKEHKSLLSSPEAREEPQLLQATLDHIQEHESWIAQFQAAMDAQALQAQANMAKSQEDAKAQAQIAKTMNATNPTIQEAQTTQAPNMPSMPKVPVA